MFSVIDCPPNWGKSLVWLRRLALWRIKERPLSCGERLVWSLMLSLFSANDRVEWIVVDEIVDVQSY